MTLLLKTAFLLLITSSLAQQNAFNIWRKTKDSSRITMPNCGISNVDYGVGDRIVGGRNALDGEFPWQISLRYKSAWISPTHMCGGTILNSKWILTAAHCVSGRSAKNFEVAVGVFKQGKKGKYQATYQVAKIIAHEKFDKETFDNDIALLLLKTDILFPRSKGYVNGACLPTKGFNASGFATSSGWGSTEEGGDMADILQAVRIPIVPQYICEALFGDDVITKNMICAGEPQGGVDTCQGDSGGPLIQRDFDGKATLIGIVSWGIGCARPGLPGIYTTVASFLDWIQLRVK